MSTAWFDMIHAAYDLHLDTDAWLDELALRTHQLVQGDGAMVYAYDASNPEEGIEIFGAGRADLSDEYFEATLELNHQSRPDELRHIYHRGILCATVSEVLQTFDDTTESTYKEYRVPVHPDTFGLSASDPAHSGIGISVPLREETRLRNDVRDAWRRIGVHLNSSWRLRRRLQESDDQPRDHGDLLEEAIAMRQRAEDAAKEGRPKDGLAIWKGLVDGRYTLIDKSAHSDHREYVLLENDYGLIDPVGLTPRESQVVAHVVQGESNKWIAYQLGIATGSVSKLLARAQARLGVESRRELIWLYQKLTR